MLDGPLGIHDVLLPCHARLHMFQQHDRYNVHVSPVITKAGDGSIADSYRRLSRRNRFPYSIEVVMEHGLLPVRSVPIRDLSRERAGPSPYRGQGCVVEPVTQVRHHVRHG